MLKKKIELIDCIEKSLYLLIIAWVLSPIFVIVIRIIYIYILDVTSSGAVSISEIEWYVKLRQIGFVSLVLILLKSIIRLDSIKKNFGFEIISKDTFIIAIAIVFVLSILSTAFSTNKLISFYGDNYRKEGLLSYIAYLGIFLNALTINKKKWVITLTKLNFLVATILSFLLIVNIYNLSVLFDYNRTASVFNNINHFGYYLCIAILCFVTFWIDGFENKYNNMLYIACYIIMIVALIENRSFGPYLAVFFALIIGLFLSIFRKRKECMMFAALVIVFVVTTLALGILDDDYVIKEVGIFRNDVSNIVMGTNQALDAGSKRWALWVNGVYFSLQRPILGYGPDNLESEYAKVGIDQDRPHNIIIQIAASLGIPAALFYLVGLYNHICIFLRNFRSLTSLMIGLECTVYAYLISSLFGNSMYYTTPFFLIFFGIAHNRLQNELFKNCDEPNDIDRLVPRR